MIKAEEFLENVETDNSTQIFGDFISLSSKEQLTITFPSSTLPLKSRWRHNGLSADFIGEYSSSYFPITENEPTTLWRQVAVKSAVNYIANELLENAMKYCEQQTNYTITIHIQVESSEIVFFIQNRISSLKAEKFKNFIKEIINSSADEFYFRQLEKQAEFENNSSPGLGLLTILNDYCAKLAWKFQSVQPQVMDVTTMVHLAV